MHCAAACLFVNLYPGDGDRERGTGIMQQDLSGIQLLGLSSDSFPFFMPLVHASASSGEALRRA